MTLDDCDEIPGGCADPCQTALTTCDQNLATSTSNLATCNQDLGTAQGNLTTCTGELGTCETEQLTCTQNLSTCTTDLASCEAAPATFPATGQARMVDAGEDGNPSWGAALAYQDNGDGTITDLNTGLMWEKKSDDGSIHDRDDAYTWANAMGTFVAALNAAGFAGHTDWRLPNVKELQSIVNYGAETPSVSAILWTPCFGGFGCTVLTCSCTVSAGYWSSTSLERDPTDAWYVSFFEGGVIAGDKNDEVYFVRAVRGGSLSQP